MKSQLRCLAIRQPWAFLVGCGSLSVDNRTWPTKHRGDIAIHASVFRGAMDKIDNERVDKSLFTMGAIIAVVELFDVVEPSDVPEEALAKGPWCFRFRNARLFQKPIQHKARVGLCKLPSDIEGQVLRNLDNCVDVSRNEYKVTAQSIIDEVIDLPPWKRTPGSKHLGW